MGWAAAAGAIASVAASTIGGSKDSERKARDDAALRQLNLEFQQRLAQKESRPFVEGGQEAQKLLAEYLGTSSPEGYKPKPTYQDAYDKVWSRIYNNAQGKGFRQTNTAGVHRTAEALYQEQLAEWEAGLERYLQNNPDAAVSTSPVHGRLLREFSNEDFVRDPGYNFRLQEGAKGIDRALAARGGTNSGAALKAIARYNQDFASNEFSNAFGRDAVNKNSIYSFLSGQAAQGLAAAQGNAGVGLSAANTSANITGNLTNTLLSQENIRNENRQNALQSGIGNAVYAFERNAPVISTNNTPGYTGGSSTVPDSQPAWYLPKRN